MRKCRNEEIDTSQLAVPERVSVALAELTARCAKGCWRWLWALGCR